ALGARDQENAPAVRPVRAGDPAANRNAPPDTLPTGDGLAPATGHDAVPARSTATGLAPETRFRAASDATARSAVPRRRVGARQRPRTRELHAVPPPILPADKASPECPRPRCAAPVPARAPAGSGVHSA